MFEQIPKDQEFKSWTNLYGVYAWQLPEYDIQRFAVESLNALAMGCKAEPEIGQIEAENGLIVRYHCNELEDTLVVNGNNAESAFLFMGQAGQSFAKVYMSWRGKAEDIDTEKWPLTEQVQADAINHMKVIYYFKAK
ncbi:hypothetical protein [Oleidesulfovibrio sp.]|uniref:hypothetical protein n=1 Tax=Oleidesulfovibrio sp. TaxID=2909707 RepID=UPI003A838085